ncbi:MAG: hypothetical protein GY950_36865 [bacterium]|nr:hypothetical protein [bacterium]
MKRLGFMIVGAACILSLIILLYFIIDYINYKNETAESARLNVIRLTHEASKKIDDILKAAAANADSITSDFSRGKLSRYGMRKRLRRVLKGNPYFYSGAVTYRPYEYEPTRRLCSFYYIKEKDNLLRFEQLEKAYDYTDDKIKWYVEGLEKGKYWSEPYLDEAAGELMTTYSSVFYEYDRDGKNRIPLGVVNIDIHMQSIEEIVESGDLGPGGFGGLLSRHGTYLYHPNLRLGNFDKTILDVAYEENDDDRIILSEHITRGVADILDHTSATTGKESWLVYQPIPSTGWSLQNTFLIEDIPINNDILRRSLFRITLAAMVLLVLLFILTSFFFEKSTGWESWWLAVGISTLLLISIGFMWYYAISYQALDIDMENDGRVFGKAALEKNKLDIENTARKKRTGEPVFIPTGVFLESMSFSDPNMLTVTGYVWQTYRRKVHDGLPKGFAVSGAESLETEEILRKKGNDTELFRWKFKAVQQSRMNYSKYPLSLEKLGICFMHKSMDEHVVLVPDLDAYPVTNPGALPGLKKGILLPGWFLEKSYFEFRHETFYTDLGAEAPELKGDYNNLYYNIVIRKDFLDSFISNLTPLILVALLLFMVLLLNRRDADLSERLILDTGGVLGFCSALFFVVVFGHIDIREKIFAQEIFYLEYFYLIMYASLLWVSLNSIIFRMKKIKLIQYKDNLIPRLFYWPVLLGLLFLVTFMIFY